MDDIPLINFAPLIQLWAGICLLFFYEPLLKTFPLSKLHEEKKAVINGFLGKYQAYLTDKQLQKGYKLSDDKWDIFYKTIQNLAILHFYYAILVLAYIGIENSTYYGNYYKALQVMDFLIIGYTFLSWPFYKKTLFTRYVNAHVFMIILLLSFHFFFDLNELCLKRMCLGDFFLKSQVSVLTMFTFLSSVIVVLLQILLNYVQICFIKYKIGKIDNNLSGLNVVILGMKKMDSIRDSLKKEALDYLTNDGFPETAVEFKDKMSSFMEVKVNEEFSRLIYPWYNLLYKRIKQIISRVIIR